MSDDSYPPIGGVKVKIKDGNDNYITCTSAGVFGLGPEAQAYRFSYTVAANGKLRFARSKGSSEYMASGANNLVVWSSHSTIAEWTLEADNRMHIHDNTGERLVVKTERDGTVNLRVDPVGTPFETDFDV